MTEEGAQFRIGDQVHAFLVDGRCGVGWITDWDRNRKIGSIGGIRRPLEESLTAGLFVGIDVEHKIPTDEFIEHEFRMEVPLVSSFHLPDECPWDR
ncbi:MAG TPA: hypothetical protein VGQ58_04190 [Candidatus Limnocylindrales bacterium]|nr:hypothetical protein [Candidatus Limnocylindrales bacterium]